jgi:hypothetical protein
MTKFYPWHGETKLPEGKFEIGAINYRTDGTLMIEIFTSPICENSIRFEFIFETPLAVRITQEGSLMSYWNTGIEVKNYNVFVAADTEFLNWLEYSSSGVHLANQTKHYAIFTDDICIEILSKVAPLVV